ncbi:MAG: adenine phosphoribosyltransferase [Sediminibacterium sp.]
MQTLQERVRELIIDTPNFPIDGIIFKDILPLFRHAELVKELVSEMAKELQPHNPTALVGMESRGFLLGMPLALKLNIPFICIRKKGKLPGEVSGISYSLEYGKAEIEIQKSALSTNDRVILHDDVLATGGTANAAAQLIQSTGAELVAFSFLMELNFLQGREIIGLNKAAIHTFAKF